MLIGKTTSTASFILDGEARSFGSPWHGNGGQMSRQRPSSGGAARELVCQLRREGIIIRSPSVWGVAEKAPGAYKDVEAVVDGADHARLSRKVAKLEPIVCVKG
jgi:tRNA-splicing ligase RtcB